MIENFLSQRDIKNKLQPHNHLNINDNLYPPTKKIQNYFFKLNDVIGKGNFSIVYKAVNQLTYQTVAIKVVQLNRIKKQALLELLYSQIQILKSLTHTNILKCYQAFSSTNNCYIITQLCNDGDLNTKIKQHGPIQESSAYRLIYDIFNGLKYLFTQGIIHRDLKIANILLKQGRAKIADFGFSKRTRQKFKDANIGSPIYMSPEGLLSNIYGPKTDVWAFGVILFEILHGYPPMNYCKTQNQLKTNIIIQIAKQNMNRDLSDDMKELIIGCLQVQEKNRMNIDQIQKSALMRKLKYLFSEKYNYQNMLMSQVQQINNRFSYPDCLKNKNGNITIKINSHNQIDKIQKDSHVSTQVPTITQNLSEKNHIDNNGLNKNMKNVLKFKQTAPYNKLKQKKILQPNFTQYQHRHTITQQPQQNNYRIDRRSMKSPLSISPLLSIGNNNSNKNNNLLNKSKQTQQKNIPESQNILTLLRSPKTRLQKKILIQNIVEDVTRKKNQSFQNQMKRGVSLEKLHYIDLNKQRYNYYGNKTYGLNDQYINKNDHISDKINMSPVLNRNSFFKQLKQLNLSRQQQPKSQQVIPQIIQKKMDSEKRGVKSKYHKSYKLLQEDTWLTFLQCVNLLHYCRLIYKTIMLIKKQELQKFFNKLIRILKNWLFDILDQISSRVPNYIIFQPQMCSKEKILKQVISQYYNKYHRQLVIQNNYIPKSVSYNHYPLDQNINSISAMQDILINSLKQLDHMINDQKIQSSPTLNNNNNNNNNSIYVNKQLVMLAHYLVILYETNVLLLRCKTRKQYEHLQKHSQLQQLLGSKKQFYDWNKYQKMKSRIQKLIRYME